MQRRRKERTSLFLFFKFGIGFETHFSQAVSDYLRKECREALLDETLGAIMKSPPRLASGQIDGFSLAIMGRPRGVNFFVIGSLTDVRFLDEKTGFWLWKKTRYLLRVVLRLEIRLGLRHQGVR